MNILTKGLTRLSGKDLMSEIAYTNKSNEHYPDGYLDMVRKEVKRRDIKRAKKEAK